MLIGGLLWHWFDGRYVGSDNYGDIQGNFKDPIFYSAGTTYTPSSLAISGMQDSKGPYSAIVYIDGSQVIAETSDGQRIATGTAGKDDATVIQAALYTGNTKLQEGRFICSNTINIPATNYLTGSGLNRTILDFYDATLTYCVTVNSAVADAFISKGGEISGLTIRGSATSGVGLSIRSVFHFLVQDIQVIGTGSDGIQILGCYDVAVDQCLIDLCSGYGIITDDLGQTPTTLVKISMCVVGNSGDSYADIKTQTGNVLMDSCWLESSTRDCPHILNTGAFLIMKGCTLGRTANGLTSIRQTSGDIICIGNYIGITGDPANKAIVIDDCRSALFESNKLDTVGLAGFDINGGSNIKISNNYIVGYDISTYGIDVGGAASEISIIGNNLYKCAIATTRPAIIESNNLNSVMNVPDAAIIVDAADCEVANNIIHNCSHHGIWIKAGADRNTVAGNHVENVGQYANQTYQGILYEGTSGVITGNSIYSANSPSVEYCIWLTPKSSKSIASLNFVSGGASGNIFNSGTSNTLLNNI